MLNYKLFTLNKNKMKKWSIIISRVLLGIIFLINGINMFAQFMPLPNPHQPDIAQRFLNILHEAGYFYPIMGIVKIATALALFYNRFLPLMLIVMFPITLNGVLFHLRMDTQMAPVAIIVWFMQVYLIYRNKDKYLPMLSNGNK
jgi:putative oxidoreductase